MEEICHVFLGHKPNRLAVIAHDERGKTLARDYRKLDEEAAYATGAAALVPFAALRRGRPREEKQPLRWQSTFASAGISLNTG